MLSIDGLLSESICQLRFGYIDSLACLNGQADANGIGRCAIVLRLLGRIANAKGIVDFIDSNGKS